MRTLNFIAGLFAGVSSLALLTAATLITAEANLINRESLERAGESDQAAVIEARYYGSGMRRHYGRSRR